MTTTTTTRQTEVYDHHMDHVVAMFVVSPAAVTTTSSRSPPLLPPNIHYEEEPLTAPNTAARLSVVLPAEQPEATIVAEAPANTGADGPGSRSPASLGAEVPAVPERRRSCVAKLAARQCIEKTADGRDCPATPLSNEPRCYQHSTDPKIVARREADRQRGGIAAALKKLPPEIPADLSTREGVRELLQGTTRAVLAGQLTPSQGNTVAGLAGIALRLAELEVSAALLALEQKLNEQDSSPTRVVVEGGTR